MSDNTINKISNLINTLSQRYNSEKVLKSIPVILRRTLGVENLEQLNDSVQVALNLDTPQDFAHTFPFAKSYFDLVEGTVRFRSTELAELVDQLLKANTEVRLGLDYQQTLISIAMEAADIYLQLYKINIYYPGQFLEIGQPVIKLIKHLATVYKLEQVLHPYVIEEVMLAKYNVRFTFKDKQLDIEFEACQQVLLDLLGSDMGIGEE